MPAPGDGSNYQAREERLLGEFLAKFFPTDRVITRVRLGSPPIGPTLIPLEPEEVKVLKAFSRWADALVIREADMILIEAEILPSPGIVSTLELYGRLLRGDPEYDHLHSLPLRFMLLWAFRDPVLEQIAREKGIEVRSRAVEHLSRREPAPEPAPPTAGGRIPWRTDLQAERQPVPVSVPVG